MTFVRISRPSRSRGLLGVTGAAAVVSLIAVGAAVYLTPSAHDGAAPKAKVKTVVRQVWPSPSPKKYVKPAKVPWPKTTKRTAVDVVHPPARHRLAVVKKPYAQGIVRWVPSESTRPNPSFGPAAQITKYKHCWDFRWQQDAQAAYLANLSDPGALDGLAGPRNGDGIACGQLPSDPSRPKSVSVDAIATRPTTAPSKAALLGTASTYYGASSDALPGDAAAFDQLDRGVGRAPSLVEFFDTWDHSYATDGPKIDQAWNRGALPVMTWMPEPQGGQLKDLSAYTLQNIIDGNWDSYLYQWAAQVTQAGLPMGIRFGHEMNGSWYPWSAGLKKIASAGHPGGLELDNTPAKFQAAWQHVWNVFNDVGANRYVIWAWTPVRSLCSTHSVTAGSSKCPNSYTTYAEDYPGDAYVDWVGLSAYAYGADPQRYTFAGTFGSSLSTLAAMTHKPVFVAETGAAQRVTTMGAQPKTFATAIDVGAEKASWTTETLADFLDQGSPGAAGNYLNPGQRVIGFVLFDNYIPNIHQLPGGATDTQTETDWRWDSSPIAAAAFVKGLADQRYLGGVMPPASSVVTHASDPDAVRWPVVPVPASTAPSNSPTTSAPTTSAPTRSAPTTSAPTTSAPTTSAPTTTAPSTTASTPATRTATTRTTTTRTTRPMTTSATTTAGAGSTSATRAAA